MQTFQRNSGFLLNDKYPLHRAAREGRAEILQNLLKTEAFAVNCASPDLVRPLHEACIYGRLQCVKILVEAGAEVNVRNIDGATPLCDACSNGSLPCIEYLLDHGAIVNPPLLMTSPLHEAVLRDNVDCIELLIKAGARVDASDCHFGTPLHISAYKDHEACASILLKLGASVNATKIHLTPLHDAARHQDVSFLTLLLNHGADIYARNNHGLLPRDLIRSSTSPAKKLLLFWEGNPQSLRHFSRLKVRKLLGGNRLDCIDQLSIPKVLKEYLKFT
ncbi:ankyrin repeat and SOCS box protein 13 [Patella vulgata]|uniref:ankyrin repeat and SOCS box protein 13 n=1 Tax=Patella vulgata TaxID=6465 RepID=UPI0021800A73|nr:ankyrin repeat and SOCS box protein 13 [Patella vulgata]